MKSLKECFQSSPRYSLKYSNYFEIYEVYFSKYRGKEITLVEVGVFHGGSLHMWRDYFGDKARIIGIDADPNALELENDGFEIFIGDSRDPNFWIELYKQLGKVDILIDDAGHTNAQQSQALVSSIENIKHEGLIVIEDTYQSYSHDFGNPSPFSFVQLSKLLVSKLMTKTMKGLNPGNLCYRINSITFFERLVIFEIRDNIPDSELVENSSKRGTAFDYRHNDDNIFLKLIKGLDVLLNLKFESIGNRHRIFQPLNAFLKSKLGRFVIKALFPVGKIMSYSWFMIVWIKNLKGWRYFRKFK